MRKFWNSIKSYVYIVVLVLIIRTWFITPAIVNGDSMLSTLSDKDIVLVNKIYLSVYEPSRFDIVVINNKHDNDKIIKRVIGMPNEKIEYKNNKLYVNGKQLNLNIDFGKTKDFKAETGEGEYFVLGDNREVSKDSRMLGNFTKDDFVGRVTLRFYPFNKIGVVR